MLLETSFGSSHEVSWNQAWGWFREKLEPQVKEPLLSNLALGIQFGTREHVVFMANVDAVKRGNSTGALPVDDVDVQEGAPMKEYPIVLSQWIVSLDPRLLSNMLLMLSGCTGLRTVSGRDTELGSVIIIREVPSEVSRQFSRSARENR